MYYTLKYRLRDSNKNKRLDETINLPDARIIMSLPSISVGFASSGRRTLKRTSPSRRLTDVSRIRRKAKYVLRTFPYSL